MTINYFTARVLTAVLALSAIQPELARAESLTTPEQLTALMAKIYTAAEAEEEGSWNTIISADFIGYEAGRRYDRAGFFAMIKAVHAKGVHFQWAVTTPKLEASGDVATLIYVNDGKVIQNGVGASTKWLETTTFKKESGTWRAVFTESMRAAASGS